MKTNRKFYQTKDTENVLFLNGKKCVCTPCWRGTEQMPWPAAAWAPCTNHPPIAPASLGVAGQCWAVRRARPPRGFFQTHHPGSPVGLGGFNSGSKIGTLDPRRWKGCGEGENRKEEFTGKARNPGGGGRCTAKIISKSFKVIWNASLGVWLMFLMCQKLRKTPSGVQQLNPTPGRQP